MLNQNQTKLYALEVRNGSRPSSPSEFFAGWKNGGDGIQWERITRDRYGILKVLHRQRQTNHYYGISFYDLEKDLDQTQANFLAGTGRR